LYLPAKLNFPASISITRHGTACLYKPHWRSHPSPALALFGRVKFAPSPPCLPSRPRLELTATVGRTIQLIMAPGEVAEWSNAPHSKCGIGASLSGVRIPPSPPVRIFTSFQAVSLCVATY